MNLPEKYMQRMRAALSDYSEYAAIFEKEPYKAVRANKLKISPSEFSRIAPFPLEGAFRGRKTGFIFPTKDRDAARCTTRASFTCRSRAPCAPCRSCKSERATGF